MKKLLIALIVVLSLAGCEVEERKKPVDVSEYVTATREGNRVEIHVDKSIDNFFEQEFGAEFEYHYDYKYHGDHTYVFKFYEKNRYGVIAYANVDIPKPDNTEV